MVFPFSEGVILLQMVSNSIGVFTNTSLLVIDVPVEHEGEELLGEGDDSAHPLQITLPCQLHEFSPEVHNPHHLLLLL